MPPPLMYVPGRHPVVQVPSGIKASPGRQPVHDDELLELQVKQLVSHVEQVRLDDSR